MPVETKTVFLKAFQHFSNYSIIWKSSDEKNDLDFFKNVSNVFVKKWIPQEALLSKF